MKPAGASGGKYSPNCSEAVEFESLGCIIMASGMGKRFGGNKLMADLDDSPMIGRILVATRGIFARRIVVTRHEDVAAFCREQGVAVLLHDLPHRSDTVRLGLDEIQEGIAGCMFCPGDQPLLGRGSIRAMCAYFIQCPSMIVQLEYANHPGTPVLFPRRCFDELMNLPQGRGGRALIQKYPGQVRHVPARDEYEMLDVDSPEDLTRIRQYLER